MDMLIAVKKAKMFNDGETSSSGAKHKRMLVQRDRVGNKVLSRKHPDVRYIDRQLDKMFVS